MAVILEDLRNKVVLVTGSSSGIGEACAILFAKNGCKVMITGRNRERLANVASKCEQVSPFHYKSVTFAGDLTKDENVKGLLENTISEYGKLDVLVNNAGGYQFSSILDENFMEVQDYIYKLNCRAPLLLSRLSLPYLIKSNGCIINISSIAAFHAFPMAMHYSMSKAALDMMTKHLAAEFGPKGIRVNSVNPGFVKTSILEETSLSQSFFESRIRNLPFARLGEPEEIANTICFLASNASAYTTGTALSIDGGFCCSPGHLNLSNLIDL